MSLESLVTTLETSKRLKTARFPEKTALAWIDDDVAGIMLTELIPSIKRNPDKYIYFSAPTAQEIADQLPPGTRLYKQKNSWRIKLGYDLEEVGIEAPTIVEALTALYLKLYATS